MKCVVASLWGMLLGGLLGCDKPPVKVNDSPPNFIIIFADDLGYGDLGCFGHPTIQTPHLDQMAQEGMKLTQFYVAASICTPSRSALLTGKLPVRNGMYGERSVLFPDSGSGLLPREVTIAEALKEQGYTTACFGKWHLGHLPPYLPTEQGFDQYFGIPYSNDMSPAQNNWDYAQANFPPTPLMEGTKRLEEEPDQSLLTRKYTDRGIEFIRKNAGTPFFLYLPHTFPHTPLYIDDENEGRSKRGLYGDVVEVLDENVGRILNTLKELDLEKNTFVLFTSDNGPWGWAGRNGGSAGMLRGAKGSPWEGGFRVPAIAWMPGTIPANSISSAIVSAMDLFPTLVKKGGGKLPTSLDGKDIWETFIAGKEIRKEMAYYRNETLIAYRKGPWKIFMRDPNPWSEEYQEEDMPLLFNVETDPAEKFNEATAYPSLVKDLETLARKFEQKIPVAPSQLNIIQEQFRENYEKYRSR